VLYSIEDSWGFGPGANETGVIVFELPEDMSAQMKSDGIEFLKRMPAKENTHGHGRYEHWQNTPVDGNHKWFIEGDVATARPSIVNYLDRYGFGIPIDQAIQQEIDRAIAVPGSYFSYSRGGGVLILIPQVNRVVYAYSG